MKIAGPVSGPFVELVPGYKRSARVSRVWPTWAMVTLSMLHSIPILLISSLRLLSLLSVSWTVGNFSLNFSFNSFFMSLGRTYSMTLVWNIVTYSNNNITAPALHGTQVINVFNFVGFGIIDISLALQRSIAPQCSPHVLYGTTILDRKQVVIIHRCLLVREPRTRPGRW